MRKGLPKRVLNGGQEGGAQKGPEWVLKGVTKGLSGRGPGKEVRKRGEILGSGRGGSLRDPKGSPEGGGSQRVS